MSLRNPKLIGADAKNAHETTISGEREDHRWRNGPSRGRHRAERSLQRRIVRSKKISLRNERCPTGIFVGGERCPAKLLSLGRVSVKGSERFAVYRWRFGTIGRLGNSSVNSAAPLVNSI